MKRINIYHILIILVLTAALVFTVFNLKVHKLLAKSAVELADSIVYYFRSLFSAEEITDQRISFLTFDQSLIDSVVPINFEVFGNQFTSMFELMANGTFASITWSGFLMFLANFSRVLLLIAMPLAILFVLYYRLIFRKLPKSNPGKDSPALICYLKFKKYILDPIGRFFANLWYEFRYGAKKMFWLAAIIIIIYNLNFFSFILSFLAWYFYFVVSINVGSIWVLVCKLLICISPLIRPFFWPFWILGIIVLVIYIKIRSGFQRLEEMYNHNDEFVDGLGIITGIYGPPGSRKNLLEIGIATQKERSLRCQAESSMMEIRSEFPDFPFRFLESEVEDLFMQGKLVNKIQIENYFRKKFQKKNIIYGYDLKKNKNAHYDQLKVRDLVHELIDYSQLYYIYISNLAASTYSVRYDKGIELDGNFPSLQYDFFHRDFRDDDQSINAKIFDLNLIRLNNQKDNLEIEPNKSKNDENITLFDFGLLTLSEFGKDRGNRYTNTLRKKQEVTPFKDGTANCLGVLRHLTTVRYKQYGFIIWDDQKLSSFSGYESAMAETNIFISKQKGGEKLAIPLWFVESTFLDSITYKYNTRYQKYIRLRNDRTLYSYFLSHVSSWLNNIQRNIRNIFGYRRLTLSLSGVNVNGSQESRGDSSFYLLNKIVYSNRYETDCYKGFFDKLKLQAKKGINQFRSFKGSAATIEELIDTKGYFASELAESILSYVEENERRSKKS